MSVCPKGGTRGKLMVCPTWKKFFFLCVAWRCVLLVQIFLWNDGSTGTRGITINISIHYLATIHVYCKFQENVLVFKTLCHESNGLLLTQLNHAEFKKNSFWENRLILPFEVLYCTWAQCSRLSWKCTPWKRTKSYQKCHIWSREMSQQCHICEQCTPEKMYSIVGVVVSILGNISHCIHC